MGKGKDTHGVARPKTAPVTPWNWSVTPTGLSQAAERPRCLQYGRIIVSLGRGFVDRWGSRFGELSFASI